MLSSRNTLGVQTSVSADVAPPTQCLFCADLPQVVPPVKTSNSHEQYSGPCVAVPASHLVVAGQATPTVETTWVVLIIE